MEGKMNSLKQSTLVIGYGNSLRRDDGIGLKVATAVAELDRTEVTTQTVHQLTPELAATLSEFDRVIFVDAAVNCEQVQLERLQPETIQGRQMGHFCDARSLLVLSQLLYHHTPEAFLITIPVADLDFGEEFSSLAEKGAAEALRIIEELLTEAENSLR